MRSWESWTPGRRIHIPKISPKNTSICCMCPLNITKIGELIIIHADTSKTTLTPSSIKRSCFLGEPQQTHRAYLRHGVCWEFLRCFMFLFVGTSSCFKNAEDEGFAESTKEEPSCEKLGISHPQKKLTRVSMEIST